MPSTPRGRSDTTPVSRRQALSVGAAVMLTPLVPETGSATEDRKRVLVLVGPSQHPPGTHEVAAGGRLLQHCLTAIPGVNLTADRITTWPESVKSLDDVASIVMIGDLFPPEVMPERTRILADLTTLMARGCGLVCLHYATGLGAKQVPEDGDHPLLHWMGGYFATKCRHHQSVARVFPKATIEPTTGDHPVLRGWKTFTVHDEPYINNYFGKNGPAKTVTHLATAKLPPEKPNVESVAWAISRPDGGRGVGIVMPHFYRNWQVDDLRTLILNAVVWSAGREVPRTGVQMKLPDLKTFQPDAVEPIPKAKGKQPTALPE